MMEGGIIERGMIEGSDNIERDDRRRDNKERDDRRE
jgi:hypothetical protein